MKNAIIKTAIAVIFFSLIFYNCNNASNTGKDQTVGASLSGALQQTVLPQDVMDSCSVSDADFAKWFADGKVTEGGFVNPANSLAFESSSNCNFYKWSEQMFLWLTSNGQKYNGGNTVLESPVFYVVSSPDSNGYRGLMQYKKDDLLDASTNINRINTEEGQATDNVLLDKNGNLLYYITFANDVYAAQLNMAIENPSSVTRFPTTQAELDNIAAFAKKSKPSLTLLEPNTLAIELKTSWVKLEKGMDKADYITIESDIPVYDKRNDSTWTLNGQMTKATLALVGMHIVGSAAGHPEMIWSTFEHKSCSPNARYQYVNKEGKIADVAPDNSGTWLLNNNPQDTTIETANKSYAQFDSKNNAITGRTDTAGNIIDFIKPSNTRRMLPWGSVYNIQPNKNDLTPYSNSLVIAVNNAVINKLAGNDARKNYIFIGSTWTTGTVPNGKPYDPNNPSKRDSVAIGTSALANSTMETDFQVKSLTVTSINAIHTCFTCHSGTLDPKVFEEKKVGLSHVFKPLMDGLKPQAQMKKKK
jgi:hypothetical protein